MLTMVTPAGVASFLEAWSWAWPSFLSVLGETLGLACQTGQWRRNCVVPFMEALPRLREVMAFGDSGLAGETGEAGR
jgi:hypothetical protein